MSKELSLQQDIETIKKVIANDIQSTRTTGKIYRNTNEILTSILRPELIKDKDVLSVLASSDQMFTCHYLGAKSVDTFDNNLLAYYYFFLRKWCVLYTGTHYISAKNEDLIKCLNYHNNTLEEKRAYLLWREVLRELQESLYYSELFHKGSIWWNVPYQNDMQTLKNIIEKVEPNYTKIDIFKPIEEPTKKYDVIILSNILEYMYENEDDPLYYEQLFTIRDNLLKLLNDNGIAISSNILDYDYKGNTFLEKYFTYEEGSKGLSLIYNKEVPLSYVLKKR